MSASSCRQWGIAPLRPSLRAVPVAAVVAIGALLGVGRAAAAPLGSCSPTHGTVVAVDFAHWGGPIVRGCGVGQRSGYALLRAAGFTAAGDQHDGPGVVCRIGDAAFHHGTQYPTPKQDNCVQTPPTTGYWAYWVAPKGTNHWAYSPLGAMGDVPKPGEVELWIFGATNVAGTHGTAVPTFSPATLRAHAEAPLHSSTTTTHTSTSTTRTATTARSATTPRQATRAPTTATTTATTTHRSASAPTHHPRHRAARRHPRHTATHRAHHHAAATTGSTSTTRTGGAKVVSAQPTSQRASAGSSTPLIVGVALAVLLCAGAGRAIWLRRREE